MNKLITPSLVGCVFSLACLLHSPSSSAGLKGTCFGESDVIQTSMSVCIAQGSAFLPSDYAGLAESLTQTDSLGKAAANLQIAERLHDSSSADVRNASVAWYQRAATFGSARANFILATLYEQGELVAKDLIQANRHFALARGDDPANWAERTKPTQARLDLEKQQHELALSEQRLRLTQQRVRILSKELTAAQQGEQAGEALSFALLTAEQQIKRAEKAHKSSPYRDSLAQVGAAKQALNKGLAEQLITSLEPVVEVEREGLIDLTEEINQQQQMLASVRKNAVKSSGKNARVESSVLAMTDQQAKDKALKRYLSELENSVQHRSVSQEREQKKLDFLEQRINRMKRQSQRRIKPDDQVILERALAQMDDRYQGKLDYLATNLNQELEHKQELKTELAVIEKQAKQDRALVATITQRLEQAADLVDRQTVLVEQQSDDLNRAIETMNRAHSQPVQGAALWAANTAIEPALELKWPEFTEQAEDWLIEAEAGSTVRVVGAVQGNAQVKSFEVDGQTVALDKNGLFVVNVDLFDKPQRLNLMAKLIDGGAVQKHLQIQPQTKPVTRFAKAAMPEAKQLNDINFGRYHALVFGNNQYGDGGFETLDTAVNDAESVAELLRTRYDFEVEVVLNANRDQMISAMESMRSKLTDLDNLLIYYAGHGIMDAESNQGYWVPVDGAVDSTKRWISNATITDQIRGMTARNVMVVADSCYSGSLMRSGMMYVRSGLTPEKKIKRVVEDVVAATRVVLSSGGLQPVIDSIDGNPNSVFTSAFLEALTENSELLDADSLATEVSHAVAMATADTVKQVPRFAPLIRAGHEGGEFYFVPNEWRATSQ